MCRLLTVRKRGSAGLNEGFLPQMLALINSSLRHLAIDGDNTHGTGTAYYSGESGFLLDKSGKNAIIHTATKTHRKHLEGYSLDYPLLAHVRRASVNKNGISKKDAQPYASDNILLMHNGTVANYRQFTEDKNRTDSWAIAKLMAQHCKEEITLEGVNAVTEQLRGSFALIFQHLSQPDTVYMLRHERPLYHVVIDEKIDVIVTDAAVFDHVLYEVGETLEALGHESWLLWESSKLDKNTLYRLDDEFTSLGKTAYKKESATYTYGRTQYASRASSNQPQLLAEMLLEIISTYPGMTTTDMWKVYDHIMGEEFTEESVNLFIDFMTNFLREHERGVKELSTFLNRAIAVV